MSEKFPSELRYAETHEWVRVKGEIAEVGISSFATEEIGDLTYIELPEVGRTLRQGEPMGVVESVKDTFDIFAPVSGEVDEVNERAISDLDTVRRDPYGEGWLVRVRITNREELNSLLSASEYAEKVSKEGD